MGDVADIKLVLKDNVATRELAIITDDPNNLFKCTSFTMLTKLNEVINVGVLGRVNTGSGFKFYLTVNNIQHELTVGDAIMLGSDGELYPLPKRLLQDMYDVYILI